MPRASLRKDLVELVSGLAGWRLEPRTTPGASPLWCFVSDGKVELSLSAEDSALVVYEMASDEEIRFSGRESLVIWLGDHRPDALQPNPRAEKTEKKQRFRKFFEWS